ncbi:conserved hypothetical protein [Candidatus Nitrosotenuis uzonensis]|uniref:Uncharacterized protein n=1 Tax=Candidatus Nitrosotenuis uzonensis TaxID=1407055 RepID=V6ARJ4_9ARCH|nr:conserved hypothetical protein [Candidatus Nitrosotenuis uzonensis]CDI05053.1 hypothetical protein NITUZ_140128 [Candidatus Nitrosotenuis uzonensis]
MQLYHRAAVSHASSPAIISLSDFMGQKINFNIFRKTAGTPRYKVGFYGFIAVASAAIVLLTILL